MSVARRHAAEAGRRTVRRGRRPAAPVGQGEDPVDRPAEAGVFARLDDMLARHRAGRPRRSPLPREGTGTAGSRPCPEPASRRRCSAAPCHNLHRPSRRNHTIITIDNTTRPPENAADAEDLIQSFHRGDDTRMANRPGHGLGLSIAKACTDAMQATLAVSRPSPGTFRAEIKLPNRPTQRHCPQQKEHGHRPHARQ